jgi:hypothetical protein
MANTILLKQSSVANAKPLTSTIEFGELALNTADGKAYMKIDTGPTDEIVLVNDVPVANTFFVSKTGSDTNTGRSIATSLATIEQALTLATAVKTADPAATSASLSYHV